MIGPAKLANKTCAASVAKMNSAHKTSTGSKQIKPSQTIQFLFELMQGASVELFSIQLSSRVKPKTFHLL